MKLEKCHNNRPPKKDGYWAQDGWQMNLHRQPKAPRFVWVEDRMSEPCGQPGKDLPPAAGCVGCEFLGSGK